MKKKVKLRLSAQVLRDHFFSLLFKKGFETDIYERRPDMRKDNSGGGKSINLALSVRGIHALKEVGLYG